ncbi:unnamed protein product [Rotaria sp. Silwood2]|nr:unnamed protein product [Rotaria sp. Silwood2]
MNKASTKASTTRILYNIGGRVLTGPTKVYVVYYGSWTNTEKNIVNTFIARIGSTAWFNITKTYYSKATLTSPKVYIKGPLTLGKTATDYYSYGTQLTGLSVQNIILNSISKRQLPSDPNGIYLVLSSADVKESLSTTSSFCNGYCGYHLYFYIGYVPYVYGFIGNPKQCMTHCTVTNRNVSPNGNPGVDGMLNLIAHELVEAMSDPFVNAWKSPNGNGDIGENADKW